MWVLFHISKPSSRDVPDSDFAGQPDILVIETKLDSRIPDILQFFTTGFGYPANCLTGYPAR